MTERGREPVTADSANPHHLWGGRFAASPADALDRLNRSLPVDHRLWPQDVRAARAWVGALRAAGLLLAREERVLLDGLDLVARRLADGAAVEAPDEDVHTLVERLLHEAVGPVAGKLNTGRSRNDQVATDLRLWTMETLGKIDGQVTELGRALCAQADAGVTLVLPGYTHGQRAQPVRWAYVLLAHAWPLVRDRERLAEAAERVSELPLGSGAVAGSGVGVDRERLAAELGFRRVAPNALDVTGDRDFVAEALFVLALLATHLSRLAGELLTYASAEYGFIRLAEEYCTGSSLLPQKRNPDVLELVRAKAARTLGDLVGLLAMLRGLPAGYSKDLQEDKALLFDAVDTVRLSLPALTGAVATLVPNGERMRAALDASLFATDLADGLVGRGVPFREAHRLVGQLVRDAEALGCPVVAVPAERAGRLHAELPGLLADLGDWERSIERRATAGGSARAAVQRQLTELERAFSSS
jgi:argininosuccinate lyase